MSSPIGGITNDAVTRGDRCVWWRIPLISLSGVEIFHRISYHGVRSILILFLVDRIAKGGFEWSSPAALQLFGLTIGFFVGLTLLGGYVCDRVLGYLRGFGWGLCLMLLGYLLLLVSSSDWGGVALTLRMYVLYGGLFVIALGNGLYQPSFMVRYAEIFPKGHLKHDNTFIYQNLATGSGSLLGSFIVGSLGELVSWRLGFAAALASMLCANLLCLVSRRTPNEPNHRDNRLSSPGMAAARRRTRPAVGVTLILVLALCAFLYSVCLEQFKGLMLLVTQASVERRVGSLIFPLSWIPGMLDLLGLASTPLVLWLLNLLQQNGCRLSAVMRFIAGFVSVALALLTIVLAIEVSTPGKVPFLWLPAAYFLMAQGDNLLWPAGYQAVAGMSGQRNKGVMMGFWLFFTSALGMAFGGYVGALTSSIGVVSGFMILSALCLLGITVLILMRTVLRRLILHSDNHAVLDFI